MTELGYSIDPEPLAKPVVTVEVEDIFVRPTGGPVEDPDWRFTDAAGHKHRGASRDTTRWVVDRTYWCEDCQDEHEEGHLECKLCGEQIEPGMIPSSTTPKHLPGRKTYFIDGVAATKEQAEAAAGVKLS